MLNRLFGCCSPFLLAVLILSASLFSQDFVMHVAKVDYLSTQAFDVTLYDSTFHPVFVDEKNTAMQMILHGERIATNTMVVRRSDIRRR
jgi:hypothetical protein